MTYDSGNYEAATAKAKELFGYDELRRRAAAAPREQRPGAARHRRLDLHRDVRPGPVAHPRPLNYGAGGWEHASIRMLATGKVEVLTGASPHGQGHETAWSQIVADRLGRAVRGRRGAARRHPDRAQGHGHLRLALARRRRRGAGAGGRQGHREGQGRSRRTCSRPASTTSSSRAAASRVKGTDKGVGIAEIALAAVHRRTTCPTASSRASTPTPPTTRTTSPSRTAPTCARWRSTPRPGRRRCASTSASTTSARSSTRSSSRARCTAASCRASRRRSGRGRSTTTQGTLVTGSFVDYTLPDGGRHDQLRRPTTPLAVDDEHPRHQGRRRGRHHRLHPRGRQRHRGCRARTSASTTSRCRARPSGCGRPSSGRRRHVRPSATTRRGAAALRGRRPQPGPLSGATDGAAQ